MTVIDDFARASYVSLTTYRKDGRGVATPVWHAVEGDEIFIWTDADAWKVKRIRNNSHVAVTVCDLRGRIKEGAPSAEGTARLLGDEDTPHVRELLGRKYVMARMSDWFYKVVRPGRRPGVGIAVTL